MPGNEPPVFGRNGAVLNSSKIGPPEERPIAEPIISVPLKRALLGVLVVAVAMNIAMLVFGIGR